MTGVNDIRKHFIRFFEKNNHLAMPSSNLVPDNDPSLLFTNSGMVQFKNIFTGKQNPAEPRAVTSQKCLRAGGKHNDLDNVGYTSRHHTFFEMLGNFSFGDYFKERAIELAWQLLTQEFSLSASRLWVTIYHDDDVSYRYWRKIAGLPPERIIKISSADNFWRMGDTGPCGPCSEIFFDHGEKIAGGVPGSENQDGERFVEIWNLVFMQYEEKKDGSRSNLPKQSIDTGMGLERIATVIQGCHDNYLIDIFQNIINASKEIIVPGDDDNNNGYRVIADHLRAMCFLISEGLLPSNEARGYVLRRIMRRAMRYTHKLGVREPVLYRLVNVLIAEMGEAYPQLTDMKNSMIDTIEREERRFSQTLDKGLAILEKECQYLVKGDRLSGDKAFKMYDTYGFPLDLTKDVLRSRGIEVDQQGFEKAKAIQRKKTKKTWAGSGDSSAENIYFELAKNIPSTEFLGYSNSRIQAIIEAVVLDDKISDKIDKGQKGCLLLNQTAFYAEAGGQIGDRGVIENADQSRFVVTDVQKKIDGLYAHYGYCEKGSIAKKDNVTIEIDQQNRVKICCHHSATHLLHAALRQILGSHVAQKGSKVEADRLRFDFSHPLTLTRQQLLSIEDLINTKIRDNYLVETRLLSLEEAKSLGATALFGEKYADEVRVVSMARTSITAQESTHVRNDVFSMELCGGTHVGRTGDIGLVKIFTDYSISADVRRIEAVSGAAALDWLRDKNTEMEKAIQILKVSPAEFLVRLQQQKDEKERLQNEVAKMKKHIALGSEQDNEKNAIEKFGTIHFIGKVVKDIRPADSRQYIDALKAKYQNIVVAIAIVTDSGSASLCVGISNSLTDRINAVDTVSETAIILGGKKGGGRADMAQSGGPKGQNAAEAINAIREKCLKIFASTPPTSP